MRYLLQVLSHKWFVLIAGLRVGGIPILRLIIHDWSKFLPSEFVTYRRKYTGGGCTREEWDRAWLHHIHHNPHHWDHWVLNGKPIPMPETYVREMVADWLGAGRGYAGSWEIQSWLDENHHKPCLHPATALILRNVLQNVGLHWPEGAQP